MSEAHVRLVVCHDCKVIEEIPDYEGPVDQDWLLETLTSRHETPSGERHIGSMFRVSSKDWNTTSVRMEIIEQIKKRTGKGLGDEFYAVHATFKEDAMRCWRQHGRTKNCDEFKSDRKRLQPDTKKERKDLGLSPARSNRFLCEFCPYFSVAMQRMRAARGDYHYVE